MLQVGQSWLPHTTAVSRGETLEAILQNVIVGLGANVDSLESVFGSIDLGLVYHAPVVSQ